MSTRHVFALIVVFCTVSQVGCVCMMNAGCGGGGCGMGGQAYNGECPSCGVADASCGCPSYAPSCGVADSCCEVPSCGCPDASCGCPDGCGSGVCGCGASARGRQCPLLARMRNAICGGGCSGCGGQAYWSEWSDSPPCDCEPCDCYGNYIGGPYGSPHGRRARLAKRNIAEELRFSEEDSETTYR